MCKTKTISFRVEEALYDRVAKSSVGVSEFVRRSVIQSLAGADPGSKKNPGNKADDHVIQSLQQQINFLVQHQDHLTGEIMYLRELHEKTMSRVLMLPGQEKPNVLTKLGLIIDNYRTTGQAFLSK